MAKIKKVKDESVFDSITNKRNKLIEELSKKLLSNDQMKKGGPSVRSANLKEAGYTANIEEINNLGKQLGLRPVKLGELRK